MTIGIVIIFGAVVGLIASKILRGSGFGLWWDIYLGATGSTIASLIMISGYYMNFVAKRDIIGMNLFSIAVDIIGAMVLIYAAWVYNRAIQFRFNHKIFITKIVPSHT